MPSFRDVSRHLKLVCDTVFQQYDNLYGFGRVFSVLSDPLPRVLLSAVFSSISPPPSQFILPLSLRFFSSRSFFLFSSFPPLGSPSRFHSADRSAGHQRGFIPHSGTGVISHGWIGNPLSLLAPPRTYLLPPEHPLRPSCAYSPTRCEIMPRLNSRIHAKCVQRA